MIYASLSISYDHVCITKLNISANASVCLPLPTSMHSHLIVSLCTFIISLCINISAIVMLLFSSVTWYSWLSHFTLLSFLAILTIWRTVNAVSISLLVQLFMTRQLKINYWIIFPKWKSPLPNLNVSLVLHCKDIRLWTGNHSTCILSRSWWIYTRRWNCWHIWLYGSFLCPEW